VYGSVDAKLPLLTAINLAFHHARSIATKWRAVGSTTNETAAASMRSPVAPTGPTPFGPVGAAKITALIIGIGLVGGRLRDPSFTDCPTPPLNG
jgi:hypothetical protein